MKTFRMIGMVIMTVLMSVGFASCSSDDGDDSFSIVGSWKTQVEGTTEIWTFYPNGTYQVDSSSSEWGYDGEYVYSNGSLTYTDRSYTVVGGKKEYTGEYSTYVYKVKVTSNNSFVLSNSHFQGTFTRM